MVKILNTEEFISLSNTTPIVDVRSPAEFHDGHIFGAVNIPVFTDQEREQVGTVYKQNSEDEAMQLGLKFIKPKLKEFAQKASKIAVDKKLLLHCWRGGKRSSSMAWLFKTMGLQPSLLKNGYKAYRNYSKERLGLASNVLILSGCTGSGKTDILKQLQVIGEQTVDLEGLAHHKGSAFGSIGQKAQLSNEQFENNLFNIWNDLDLTKTIWIEDESVTIGKNHLPQELYKQMREAPVIRINLDRDIRVKRLVQEYTYTDKECLIEKITKIQKRLNPVDAKLAIEAVNGGDFAGAIDYVLKYYDKAYSHGINKRVNSTINELDLKNDDPQVNAEILVAFKGNLQ